MRKVAILSICLMFALYANAQQELQVPQLSTEQIHDVLYNHVMGYALTGVSFAKSQGVSPYDYGKYVGNQFKAYWNPEDGMQAFASGIMYILSGLHPDNEMEIVEQTSSNIRFKLKNVDLPFKEGNPFGISFNEFLDFSKGIIGTLAQYMQLDFEHRIDGEWYEVTLIQQK